MLTNITTSIDMSPLEFFESVGDIFIVFSEITKEEFKLKYYIIPTAFEFLFQESHFKPEDEYTNAADLSSLFLKIKGIISSNNDISNVKSFRTPVNVQSGSYWLETRISRITGRKRDIICVIKDITDAVLKEQQIIDLKNQSQINRQFFNASQELYLIIDKHFTIIDANPASLRQSKEKRGNFIGKTLFEIVPNFKDNERYKAFKHTIETGEEVVLDEVRPHPRFGSIIFNIRSFKVNNELTGIILLDITKQKLKEKENLSLIEELQQKNIELNQFAYAISHDLKAPLRGVSLLSENLVDQLKEGKNVASESIQELLHLLQSRVLMMHNLIESLLMYSRFIHLKAEPEELETKTFIQEIIAPMHLFSNVDVIIIDLPEKIFADRTKLTRILTNLVDNAVYHNDKEMIKIELSAQEDGKHWIFSIKDNGPGIKKEYFTKIFELFQKIDTKKTRINSTGIGLTLVKKLVEQMGGKIWLESEIGKGSTFYFSILKE